MVTPADGYVRGPARAAQASRAGLESGGSNPIVLENALPGTAVGLAPNTAVGGSIEGYASEVSALPGQTLHFHVSTNPAALYRVELYRLGWYQGAGARLVGCSPNCSGFEQGQPQPVPAADANGLVQCNWPVTDTFSIPQYAVSGYYRVRFVLSNGVTNSTYVIVRAPPNYHSAILVQVPVNTWQAYNSWGGYSLYNFPGQQANRVSFDRPYAWNAVGSQNPFGWEYPLVLFLEESGYDVSYQTDLDTDANPASLLDHHRLVIVLGHDEYWTMAMRHAFEAARDSGVNLAFMGANDGYWQVRYEDGGSVIVGYKSNADPIADPSLKTILFRALTPPDPECELIGIQHQGGELNWPPGDYSVVPSSLASPWFAGTGFSPTSVLTGLAGVETDTIAAGETPAGSCGHKLTVYFERTLGGPTGGDAAAVSYVAPSGATVFAAGSRQFVWGLADPPPLTGRDHGLVDPRLQRFVANMLDDLSARRVARLSLSLSPETTATRAGSTVKVLAVITNRGPDTARYALLDLTIPPGFAFVRVASTGLGCTWSPVHCLLDALPKGGTVQAVFTLRATTADPQPLAARAYILTAADPNPPEATVQLP